MSIIIQSDIQDEFLTKKEIERLTGRSTMRTTMDWLNENDWHYTISHKNEIIIGRWYARLKMAGVGLTDIEIEQPAHLPRLDRVG